MKKSAQRKSARTAAPSAKAKILADTAKAQAEFDTANAASGVVAKYKIGTKMFWIKNTPKSQAGFWCAVDPTNPKYWDFIDPSTGKKYPPDHFDKTGRPKKWGVY